MERRTFLQAALAAALATALGGCARGSAPPQPPPIRYGRDVCEQCGMILSEVRYAAAYVTPGGDAHRFDDIGCLVTYRQLHPEPAAAIFVHAYGSQQWLAAESASYVRSPRLMTPMGYGLAAADSEAAARALAGEKGGEVLTWQALMAARPAQQNR